ncbi:ectoine/hydroxyectoine ABC transporter substrate-binding protein EhuB [Candidatus Manganitrophus noduliformans]|uniref:Ectoine/hydroxyectoine ABC transporter substrate-binding protein EhuB n=1 Tax=Candidatus Manganitrophus noduliformans TaxID=2606439 RepID=A0A7X6DL94_9BACT|nr:ectoine/hydroxyectoine ABC transporter substrate-binding protein EhuB [Candidatus Manganitrophus noduliformans]NKE69257.1 ectoine/hydroxyectoine ABC transporter substrate-binding protein EhuB [Candidatus Manganitrophus noduliformans]
MKIVGRSAAGWMVLVGLLLATGCDRGRQESASFSTTLERVRSQGKIRLGYANEAPYAYYDTAAGKLTGEAPEIARAVLGEMGVTEVEGVLTEFGALIPGLKAGRFDIIAAGMYITPARCREIAFSNPTYGLGEAFLVKAGNPLGLHSYEEAAAHPTARLGVVAGAVERRYAQATGVPESRIAVLPDAPSAVAAVQAGRVDAYAGTSLTIQNLLSKARDPGIERAEPFRDPIIDGKTVIGYGAFGLRKEDTALLNEFNAHLERFIGSPRHLAVVAPFGFTEADLPGEITAEALCRP